MPMLATCDMGGMSLEEFSMHGAHYRVFDYKDETAVRTFSYLFRLMWNMVPPEPKVGSKGKSDSASDAGHTVQDVYDLMGPISRMTEGKRAAYPKNTNKENWQSNWRKALAKGWCHVLSDVTGFLYGVNCTVGHWHSTNPAEPDPRVLQEHGPGYTTFDVSYLEPFEDGAGALVLKYPTIVAIVPMFVDKGVKVKVARTSPGDCKAELHERNDDVRNTTGLFLRKELEVEFLLELDEEEAGGLVGDTPKTRTGVAATFTYATLCRRRHNGWSYCCVKEIEDDELEADNCTCAAQSTTDSEQQELSETERVY